MSDISGKIGSLDDLHDENHLDLVKNEIAEISANEEIIFDDYEENDFEEASASALDDLHDDNAEFSLGDFEQQVESGAKKGFFASLFRQPEEPLNAVPVGLPANNAEFNANDLEIISDYSDESDFRVDVTETASDSFTDEAMVIQGGVGTKIATALVGLVVLTLALTSFVATFQIRQGLVSSLSNQRLSQTETIADLITAFFVEEINPLVSVSVSSTLVQASSTFSNSYLDEAGLPLSQGEILAQIEALDLRWRAANDNDPLIVQTLSQTNPSTAELTQFAQKFPAHVEIFTTDLYGATVASTNRLSDYYQADEGWWQAAWNNGQGAIYISEPELDDSMGVMAQQVALPLRNEAGAITGILRSTISLDSLITHVSDPKFGETGYAVLLNNQGNTIVDPGLARGSDSNQLISSVKQAATTELLGTQIAIDEKGDSTIFSYAKLLAPAESTNDSIRSEIFSAVNNLDWSILTRQASSEAFSTVNQIITWIAGVGLFAILISLIIAVNISRGITRPIQQLASLSNRVASGDLSKLANVQSNDEVGYLAQSFNTAIQRLRGIVTTEEERDRERAQREELQANVGNFLDVAMDIANGDLTKRGQVSEDVLGNVIDAINLMVEEVGYLLQDVQIAALSVNSGSQEMLQTTEAITQSTLQQSQEAQQATQEVAEVTKSIREMAENAQTSAEASQQAFLASEQGQEAVTNTLGGMQNIRREVQSISKRIKSLGDRSLEISEIVDTISGISRQTNLLALNAAIEASGAGEAGRRFAIVADEVRKLADDSAKATERIAGLIKNVQAEVQEVVISVEDGTREVETGYRVATEAGQRLKEIGDISQRSAQLAELISQATQAQVAGVEQVGNKVTSIAGIAETSQSNVEQGRDVAQNLKELAEKLAQSLERFRIA